MNRLWRWRRQALTIPANRPACLRAKHSWRCILPECPAGHTSGTGGRRRSESRLQASLNLSPYFPYEEKARKREGVEVFEGDGVLEGGCDLDRDGVLERGYDLERDGVLEGESMDERRRRKETVAAQR